MSVTRLDATWAAVLPLGSIESEIGARFVALLAAGTVACLDSTAPSLAREFRFHLCEIASLARVRLPAGVRLLPALPIGPSFHSSLASRGVVLRGGATLGLQGFCGRVHEQIAVTVQPEIVRAARAFVAHYSALLPVGSVGPGVSLGERVLKLHKSEG